MTHPQAGHNDAAHGRAQNAPAPQRSGPSAAQFGSGPSDPHRTPSQLSQRAGSDGREGVSEAVVGPFSLRETVFGASVIVVFLGSILPFFGGADGYGNLWNVFPLFFLGVGIVLPVVALALILSRRLGTPPLSVGSLSVDQFASVASAFAAAFFFLQTVTDFNVGPLVALFGAVGMLISTVAAPHLPFFASDFRNRPEASAHPVARQASATRPQAPKPVPAEQVSQWNDPHAAVPPGNRTQAASTGSRGQALLPGDATQPWLAGTHGNSGPAGSRQVPAESSAAAPPSTAVPSSSAASPQSDTRDAHPDSEVGPVPGVQDKELRHAGPKDDFPRSADEDFAPPVDPAHPVESTNPVTPQQRDADTRPPAGARTAESRQLSASGQNAHQPAPAEAGASAAPAATVAQPVVVMQESEAREPESISATRSADEEEQVVEAFWFAVGTPRPVFDEASGSELFVLEPGDWEVGIEDRGAEFLVQDKRTGRIGVMRDLSNIERAPQES